MEVVLAHFTAGVDVPSKRTVERYRLYNMLSRRLMKISIEVLRNITKASMQGYLIK